MNRLSIIIAILFYCFTLANAQDTNDKFNISITVKGVENSFLTIGYHLGDRQYIKDTIYTDNKGHGVYRGDEELEKGLYLVLLPDNKYFDIIIDSDQNFELVCSKEDIVGSMIVKGSVENNDFLVYQREWMDLQNTSRKLKEKMQAESAAGRKPDSLGKAIADHEVRMLEFLKSTANNKPGSFLSLLVRALIPVEVPEFNIPENSNNIDSLRWISGYNYNKDHFFDNIDLSDSRLVRTPILHNRLKTYFSRILIQHPDSLNSVIPEIVSKSEGDSVMFRYLVVFLFNHFRESPIMGHDGVTVKIIDDYYLSGKANWIDKETYNSLSEDANRLRTNLIGKKAVDLVMETYNGQHQSLYDIKKYFTIVYFWEPNCGHCKTTTPQLKELYNRLRTKDVEVFAVCTQDNREEWERYIAENELDWINGWDPERATHFDFFYNVNATPLIYILDREKTIIAKKIGIENVESFLNDYRKHNH